MCLAVVVWCQVPLAPHKEVEVTLLLPIDRLGLLIGKVTLPPFSLATLYKGHTY